MKETFLLQTNQRVLIIDDCDLDDMSDMLSGLKDRFPHTTIYAAKDFKDSELNIQQGQYDVILLDASLRNWGLHKRFESYGWNLIPYIRETSPMSKIIAISNTDVYNAKMIAAGADDCINKEVLLSLTPAKELLVA